MITHAVTGRARRPIFLNVACDRKKDGTPLFAALDLVSRAMSDSDEPEPSSAAEDSDDDFDDEAVEQ